MLYLNPAPRLVAIALVRTFIYPWDSFVLGGVICALAALGGVVLLRPRPANVHGRRARRRPVSRVPPALPGHELRSLRAAAGGAGRVSGDSRRRGRGPASRAARRRASSPSGPSSSRRRWPRRTDPSRARRRRPLRRWSSAARRSRPGRWGCTRPFSVRSKRKRSTSRRWRRRRAANGSSSRATGGKAAPSRSGFSPIRGGAISRSSIRRAVATTPTSRGRSRRSPRLGGCDRRRSRGIGCRRRAGSPRKAGR